MNAIHFIALAYVFVIGLVGGFMVVAHSIEAVDAWLGGGRS